jgi:D-3-phosphoglycerate dehydrogenase
MSGLGRVLISAAGFGRTGDHALRLLREAGCEIVLNERGTDMTEQELLAAVRDVDAIIAGTEPITAAVLDAAQRLRVIARRGVGYDSVDVAAATARGIPVAITGGVLSDTVADMTMALILAVARRVCQFDRMVKSGAWDRVPTTDVWGKTLGIVGLGAIGRAVARRAAGFDMQLLAYDTQPDTAAAAALGVRLCDLDTLLAESDIVTLHVPLGPSTRGLIGEAALRRMKPTAILVNTSRGAVVDEEALERALREDRLAGAGLDVFVHEPPKSLSLVALPQVVATPHVASHTVETLRRMEISCADAVLAALRGERPRYIVNPAAYDRHPTVSNS